MFDLQPGNTVDVPEVAQMMQVLDVQILMRSCRTDGRRPVVVKGPERNAGETLSVCLCVCVYLKGYFTHTEPKMLGLKVPLNNCTLFNLD